MKYLYTIRLARVPVGIGRELRLQIMVDQVRDQNRMHGSAIAVRIDLHSQPIHGLESLFLRWILFEGYHIKILEKMSDILGNPDILTYGNAMRMKRNLDLYEGGTIVSESEVKAYIKFVGEILNNVNKRIGTA